MLPDGCRPDRSPDLLRLIIGTRTGLSIITYVMFRREVFVIAAATISDVINRLRSESGSFLAAEVVGEAKD
jgi:hypothetical protein